MSKLIDFSIVVQDPETKSSVSLTTLQIDFTNRIGIWIFLCYLSKNWKHVYDGTKDRWPSTLKPWKPDVYTFVTGSVFMGLKAAYLGNPAPESWSDGQLNYTLLVNAYDKTAKLTITFRSIEEIGALYAHLFQTVDEAEREIGGERYPFSDIPTDPFQELRLALQQLLEQAHAPA